MSGPKDDVMLPAQPGKCRCGWALPVEVRGEIDYRGATGDDARATVERVDPELTVTFGCPTCGNAFEASFGRRRFSLETGAKG